MEMTTVNVHIDNVLYAVIPGKNLLETCLALGFDIPYFCFHPAMGSVGACRLCAVKKYANPDDKRGRIIMSCMEEVVDGMIISVKDAEVKAFRASVLESLMISHPHDCPVCDEGGECHLQDMVVMTGHNYRRYEFNKQTYYNQELGPFINHEMNRCIQCYRCVRFYRNYAGGKDLNIYGSASHLYFGRQKEGVLENEFSGNLVEVCPTGVFTDKTLKKHYTRKWDLTNAPSVCVHCSTGCNTIVGSRYGKVRRVLSRYNGSVNGFFICDRGRFGYEFLNGTFKQKQILFRNERNKTPEEDKNQKYLPWIKNALSGKRIIGIGSPRASLESNYALSALVGNNNFCHGISGADHALVKKAIQILKSGNANIPSLKEIENCDSVLVLGEDVTNTAPMIALAVRQAARNKYLDAANRLGIKKWNDTPAREIGQDLNSPVFIASPFSTKLDELGQENYHADPDKIADLGFSVASLIDPSSPTLSKTDKSIREISGHIAAALIDSQNPLIITGIHSGNEDILNASANIALALTRAGKKSSLSIIFTECNSPGLGMMDGGSLDEVIDLVDKERIETLIIAENDLYRRISREKADLIFERSDRIIVLDHIRNETTAKADLLLPVASFAETTGTVINNEGRAQRYYSALPESEQIKSTWCRLSEMIGISGNEKIKGWSGIDDIAGSMAVAYPFFDIIRDKMPSAGFRYYNEKIPRQTNRFSGRTAMDADRSLSEPKPPPDTCSPLEFSMEGYKGYPPSDLIPWYWSPGWNSVQAMNKYMEEPNGRLKNGGDPGVLLFKKDISEITGYFIKAGLSVQTSPGEILVVPVRQIFGSEELSSLGEAIAGRTSKPFIIMNGSEIKQSGLTQNEMYQLQVNNNIINVIVKMDNSVPDGIAGISYGIHGVPYLNLPAPGRLNSKTAK
jgi:NADH-quinone oxidoreductase subunit G